ncbi:hypothetical protein, partial [Pseudarthrobacter siccitolerans]
MLLVIGVDRVEDLEACLDFLRRQIGELIVLILQPGTPRGPHCTGDRRGSIHAERFRKYVLRVLLPP